MRLDKLITVVFTHEELKEALIGLLDCDRNELLFSDPKHVQLSEIIDHAKDSTVDMEWIDGEFFMSIDGVIQKEEL